MVRLSLQRFAVLGCLSSICHVSAAAAAAAAASSVVLDNTPQLVSGGSEKKKTAPFAYNVCNGLSNQLLAHASSIAYAAEEGYEEVDIPNYFIVNGAQEKDGHIVKPTSHNSVAFGVAFDAAYFLTYLEETLHIRGQFVEFDDEDEQQPECSFLETLTHANAAVVRDVLAAFRPSTELQAAVDSITSKLDGEVSGAKDSGMCVHYRGGKDWIEHCERWSSLEDGVYRGNCLGEKEDFADSLEFRTPTTANHDSSTVIYLCSDDNDVPEELKSSDFEVFNRNALLDDETVASISNVKPGVQNPRDMWALIDFFVCSDFPTFVGNSVSTFSALQIALRERAGGEAGGAFWYNSQGIPLSDFWNVYEVPIVYTYTELSHVAGKHMLMASIASVRKHMPDNSIHILYNGNSDLEFQTWLKDHKVIIHEHDPAWKSDVEKMRLNGDESVSHLFAHAGNYFGTWQRIDVPLFLKNEYALMLDADTIINRPFSMSDFGQDLTRTLAMSSEMDINNDPVNAGVMLLNIPFMRSTHGDFMEFIQGHIHSPEFNNFSPSDQGAYLEFYEKDVNFLSRCFNFKPYYHLSDMECEKPFVIHFHGAKPQDYVMRMMDVQCESAVQGLCNKLHEMPSLCLSLQAFARSTTQEKESKSFCSAVIPDQDASAVCNALMGVLAEREDDCDRLSKVISEARVLNKFDGVNPDLMDLIVYNLDEPTSSSAIDRKLQGESEAPSQSPTSVPGPSCSEKNEACTKNDKECCNFKKGLKCDKKKKKCIKCLPKKKGCKNGKKCCSGKCALKKGMKGKCK